MGLKLTVPFGVYLPPKDDDEVGKYYTWYRLRKMVIERDGMICKVCGVKVSHDLEVFHMIDRGVQGKDIPSNLIVSCFWCNHLKPYHRTIEEYAEWVKSGFWVTGVINTAVDAGIDVSLEPIVSRFLTHYEWDENYKWDENY